MKQPTFGKKVKWSQKVGVYTLKEGRTYVGSIVRGLTDYNTGISHYHVYRANPDPMRPSVEILQTTNLNEAKRTLLNWYESHV